MALRARSADRPEIGDHSKVETLVAATFRKCGRDFVEQATALKMAAAHRHLQTRY